MPVLSDHSSRVPFAIESLLVQGGVNCLPYGRRARNCKSYFVSILFIVLGRVGGGWVTCSLLIVEFPFLEYKVREIFYGYLVENFQDFLNR